MDGDAPRASGTPQLSRSSVGATDLEDESRELLLEVTRSAECIPTHLKPRTSVMVRRIQ
jgi:hypothetical protein